VGALAEWLGIDLGYLRWFADLKGLGYKSNRRRADSQNGSLRIGTAVAGPKPASSGPPGGTAEAVTLPKPSVQSSSKLRHYHYRILAKDSGSIRLIEAPKQALKKLQQRILSGILDKVA